MHRVIVHIAGVLLVALIGLPVAASAAPSITVSPDPAPLGTRVSIRGTGFPTDTMLTLTIATDTTPPQVLMAIPIPTDENGDFRAGLTTPSTASFAAGRHIATVTGQSGGAPLASVRFTLTGDAGPASSVATTDSGATSSV